MFNNMRYNYGKHHISGYKIIYIKNIIRPDMVVHACYQQHKRLRQEDHKSKANLGNLARPSAT